MDIYNIKDTYIEFIRAYDNRVADSEPLRPIFSQAKNQCGASKIVK